MMELYEFRITVKKLEKKKKKEKRYAVDSKKKRINKSPIYHTSNLNWINISLSLANVRPVHESINSQPTHKPFSYGSKT